MAGVISLVLIPQIKVDPEIRNYIPLSVRSRAETENIEKEFGAQDMIVILFSDSCIITKDNLNRIKNIDRAMTQIGGVSGRISPFTIKSIGNQDGVMIVDPLIRSIPENDDDIIQLGNDILENRFARDVVISSDLSTASITATIDNTEGESNILHSIDSVINSYPGKAAILKGGLPYIRQSILNDVTKDVVYLVPAALIVMFLVLKFNLGKWRSVFMPFTVVLLSTAFSVAIIPLLGWKMSIITILVPVILIAVANNYGIYLVARFQELSASGISASKHEIIRLLVRNLSMPVLFSGLTTIAGILGLLVHSIIPARQVGVLAAAGVTIALLMSLLLIPAMIFISSAGKGHEETSLHTSFSFSRLISGLASLIIKYPGRILTFSGAFTILVSTGIVFLRINTNQETYFSVNHPVRKASEIINSRFGGSQTVSVLIGGDIKDPLVMQGIDNLTRQIGEEYGVGSVFSISEAVREMSKAIFTSTEEGYDRIPTTREAIAQMFELYNMSGDQEDFKQLMNLENTKAHILIRLSDPVNSVINNVKSKIEDLTRNFPATVITGGYAVIMADFARSIIRGQVWSLIIAVISVLFLLTLIFRSVKGGLTGILPLVASVLILFGFMGYAGIALDAATALLSSIMIGVGVDFTIQYIWCFNLLIREGSSYTEATVSALKTIGRSIIINALSVMAGFSVLMFSGFLSIRFFGCLVIISIGSCLIGAIVVIPALLVKFRPRFIGFESRNIKYRKNEKKNDVIGITTAAFTCSSSAS